MPRAAARSVPAAADTLQRYRSRRHFGRTPEPDDAPPTAEAVGSLGFVIQKHAASRLHYDFRLELDGVLLSWAVPKGPSLDPRDKRLAVRTEDHPLAYAAFEGTIPAGEYGAGEVIVWDAGRWTPAGDARAGLAAGKLRFRLDGAKLHGEWELVRLDRSVTPKQEPWLLLKRRDDAARPREDYDVIVALPDRIVRDDGVRFDVLPTQLAPQLASRVEALPAGGDWVHEIKFDGYRVLARCDEAGVRLYTRGGHDWTHRMASLVPGFAALAAGPAWIDGEVVVLGADGRPDFAALQQSMDLGAPAGGGAGALTCFVFDAPFLRGEDLREQPLRERRERLRALVQAAAGRAGEAGPLRFSEAFEAPAAQVLEAACRLGLEGVIAKRLDAPYRSGRSDTWLKLKCQERQEFVVGGYTLRSGSRHEIGSLLLGLHDEAGALLPVGSVGTGWDAATARALHGRLSALVRDDPPFVRPPLPGRNRAARPVHWVAPQLVVEVKFAAWTAQRQLRHARYAGLREDKAADQVTDEPVLSPPAAAPPRRMRAAAGPAVIGAPRLTHPDRVVDADSGLSKRDLWRYLESVAAWLLPQLAGRPVSMVRAPAGVGGTLFFQKHRQRTALPGVADLDAALWPGHEPLMELHTLEGLAAAAQMNVIEFHTWNATASRIDRPDRIVFDLDPGEGVTWPQVQEAALLVRNFLQQLGLASWLKTSGGKGLHVVVPVSPTLATERVKAFAGDAVRHLARTIPERFVAVSGPKRRVGRIFVDYLRNGFGATTVAAYSPRARPGLGVSMPVAWDELDGLRSGAHWTVQTAREHLSLRRIDPWADLAGTKQTLPGALRRLAKGAASRG